MTAQKKEPAKFTPSKDCQCGRGCTREQRLDAERRGRELAEELGPGWKPHVWDNLGWHVSAEALGGYLNGKNGLTVYAPDGKGRKGYSVMGNMMVLGSGRTLKTAVKRAHDAAWELRERAWVLESTLAGARG